MDTVWLKKALADNMTKKELRLLVFFVCIEEDGGRACIPCHEVAQHFKTTVQDISSTTRLLEEKGYIRRKDKTGRGRGSNAYDIEIAYGKSVGRKSMDFFQQENYELNHFRRQARKYYKHTLELQKENALLKAKIEHYEANKRGITAKVMGWFFRLFGRTRNNN